MVGPCKFPQVGDLKQQMALVQSSLKDIHASLKKTSKDIVPKLAFSRSFCQSFHFSTFWQSLICDMPLPVSSSSSSSSFSSSFSFSSTCTHASDVTHEVPKHIHTDQCPVGRPTSTSPTLIPINMLARRSFLFSEQHCARRASVHGGVEGVAEGVCSGREAFSP